MKKELKNYSVELSADDGKVLTTVSDVGRVFARAACTANPGAWEEWGEEQAEAWRAENEVEDIEPLGMEDW